MAPEDYEKLRSDATTFAVVSGHEVLDIEEIVARHKTHGLVPSANQRLPSEPLVMARGLLLAVGTLNCFTAATGGAAVAALPSESARPPASTVAIARASRLDIVPP
jgi:hypothetical protein